MNSTPCSLISSNTLSIDFDASVAFFAIPCVPKKSMA
jgi:hypothetical protein